MKIAFADERIKEYVNGNFYAKNTGEAIDVSAANASDFLNAKHFLDGEFVNVFEAVGEVPKRVRDAKELAAAYPEGFPHSDKLVAAGFSHEDAVLLAHEQLIEIDGIGSKSADAIIAFNQEK